MGLRPWGTYEPKGHKCYTCKCVSINTNPHEIVCVWPHHPMLQNDEIRITYECGYTDTINFSEGGSHILDLVAVTRQAGEATSQHGAHLMTSNTLLPEVWCLTILSTISQSNISASPWAWAYGSHVDSCELKGHLYQSQWINIQSQESMQTRHTVFLSGWISVEMVLYCK
jgi:hypothetical protein